MICVLDKVESLTGQTPSQDEKAQFWAFRSADVLSFSDFQSAFRSSFPVIPVALYNRFLYYRMQAGSCEKAVTVIGNTFCRSGCVGAAATRIGSQGQLSSHNAFLPFKPLVLQG